MLCIHAGQNFMKTIGFISNFLKNINKIAPKEFTDGGRNYCETPIFAIGDVHGCDQLLKQLLVKITELNSSIGINSELVFLGDYIDRGPNSKGVIETIIEFNSKKTEYGFQKVITLMGNHEYALLEFLNNPDVGEYWCRYGGDAALASYGVKAPLMSKDVASWENCNQEFIRNLPQSHLEFYKKLSFSYQKDNLFFCHAGIRPNIELNSQNKWDLINIREDFTNWTGKNDCYIVHGHTSSQEVVIKNNRICLDSGAYATGKLSGALFIGNYIKIITT